jgi:hypothetical protein
LFNTIQEATHYVKTAYDDSDLIYSSNIIPMHDICQGYGASPAIWAVGSTHILNMLWAAKLGFFLVTSINQQSICLVGFSFVSDTGIIQETR